MIKIMLIDQNFRI